MNRSLAQLLSFIAVLAATLWNAESNLKANEQCCLRKCWDQGPEGIHLYEGELCLTKFGSDSCYTENCDGMKANEQCCLRKCWNKAPEGATLGEDNICLSTYGQDDCYSSNC